MLKENCLTDDVDTAEVTNCQDAGRELECGLGAGKLVASRRRVAHKLDVTSCRQKATYIVISDVVQESVTVML